MYHVASGVRNPFRYGRLVELVQAWFIEHPLYDSDGQPIVVPAWSFPGRGRVQRQLSRATKAMEMAEKVVGSLPIRGRQANWLAALEERHLLADRALGYVELYGAYTETEARYRVDRLMALWDRMDEDDRQTFCLDPAAVDWATYVRDIHLPSVIEHARVRTAPTKSNQPSRADRARKAILSPDRHLAAFDLENTLIASNVVDSYAWLASRHLSAAERVAFVADLVREAPSLLALDRRDRGDFLRSFYRRYEGAPVDRLRDDGWELFHQLLLAKSFPAGFARVRQHRALGHRTLLITGALDLVVEPMRPLFDDIVCARLGEVDGTFTGRLEELPPIGEARALVLADYAEAEGLRLEESMAYADSASDLPMLEAVGFPVAVNPEAKLAAIARRRGWHVENWRKADGGAQPVLPLGPLDRRGSRQRGRTSPAALSGALRRVAAGGVGETARADEGTGRRQEPPPLCRLPGGLRLRCRPRRRYRSPAPARRRAARAPRRRLVPPAPAAVGDLRERSGHPRRSQLAVLRGAWSAFPSSPATRWSGVLDEGGVDHRGSPLAPGTRAVIEPVLGCAPRGIHPPCPHCAAGHTGLCGNVAFGDIDAGLQTGFCAATGGGWSTAGLVAHSSQLHAVPDELPTTTESSSSRPPAPSMPPCRPTSAHGDTVAVIGAGTLGLAVVAALHHLVRPATDCTVMVGAKHPHQRQRGRVPAVPMRWSPPTSWPVPFGGDPVRWCWPDGSPKAPTWSSTAWVRRNR